VTALELAPAPGPAPALRMLATMTAMELRLTLRRGESLLLTLVIPVVLLVFFAQVDVLGDGTGDRTGDPSRLDFLVPGVLALAVMSTSMTGLAIATGFERQYGVLKRLGASPLPRVVLLAAKALAVLVVQLLQSGVITSVGLALGWRPAGGAAEVAGAVPLVLLGTAAFAGLGLLMAGTLRAEATLAAANGLYVVLLLVGGVLLPLARLPDGVRAVARLLPTSALSDGLRAALSESAGLPVRPFVVLALWGAGALAAAAATFRWE